MIASTCHKVWPGSDWVRPTHPGCTCNHMLPNTYALETSLIHLLSCGCHRKFRNYDVSTSITKSAPDFCSVYVISKGKVVSVRSAQRPVVNTAVPPKLPSPRGLPPQALPDNPELEDVARYDRIPFFGKARYESFFMLTTWHDATEFNLWRGGEM